MCKSRAYCIIVCNLCLSSARVELCVGRFHYVCVDKITENVLRGIGNTKNSLWGHPLKKIKINKNSGSDKCINVKWFI